MKVTLLAENLQKKLSFITHAVPTRNPLPILSHILIEARDKKVILHATDLEIGIETTVPSDVQEEGSVTVPAKIFTELISSLPSENIHIHTQAQSLFIETTKTKSSLQTGNKEEFPSLFEEKGEKIITIPPEKFQKEFSRVVFAASIEATRPALSGILLKQTEEGFVFVATDGYRLSLSVLKKEKAQTKNDWQLLVPARVIREAVGLKDEGDIDIYASREKHQVLFTQGQSLLVGRLIEAQFPNYQKIIPVDSATTVTFDREALLRAVKTCAIFAREAANIITLSFGKNKITVSAKTAVGDNEVEIDGKLTGEENEIAFNARYLLDVLGNVPEEELVFEMTGPLNAGVFKIAGEASFLHLIMPIRTQS